MSSCPSLDPTLPAYYGASLTSAGLSVLGCLFIMITYLCFRKYSQSLAMRIVFKMSFTAMCGAACIIVTWVSVAMNQPFVDTECNAMAFVVLVSYDSSALFTLCLAINLLIVVRRSNNAADVKISETALDYIFMGLSWGLPLVLAGLATLLNTWERSGWTWCRPRGFYLTLFFILPIALSYVATMVVCVRIMREVSQGLLATGQFTDNERQIEIRVARRLCLFLLPTFIVFLPNLLSQMLNECVPEWLIVINDCVVPLQGFLNSLVFGFNRDLRHDLLGCCGFKRPHIPQDEMAFLLANRAS